MTNYRRFLQFSLRTSLVLTTLVAIGLGYLCKQARDQKAAVQRILELGGSVTYDYELAKGRRVKDAAPPGPVWLRRIIGNEFFQNVTSVHLDGSAVTDADLRLVGRLTRIESLHLSDTSISDAGLAHITRLWNLNALGLSESRITGAGLRHVQELGNLVDLGVYSTAVDDEGLKHLTNLSKLSGLNLSGTRITSKGVSHLRAVPALRYLDLHNTAVGDSAIHDLAGMEQLAMLNLSSAQFTGGGLLELRSMLPACEITGPMIDLTDLRFESAGAERRWKIIARRMQALSEEGNLKFIDLSNTDIADEHLPALHNLVGVDVIDLRDTNVSDGGLEQLRKALPYCEVVHESTGR